MRRQILSRNGEHGLARLLAGYAWKWRSRKDRSAFDIEIGDVHLRWNSTDKDWINRPTSVNEVGSIHTVQGYDLNYAGVIIGPD
ncbi:AAA family ATPase, partial [Bacillus cereus]